MIDTKKQAENAFGKGLVMDSHPINADNNTLSNCLNGTLITYNGNENMLQNDMGNGRVETAYLPPGYVPIGIKEHGGIIYVASYNPLTNRGQVGSFPSPERNISSAEKGDSALVINPKETFGFDITNGVDTLYKKYIVLNDNTLRPGDKFAIGFNSPNTNYEDLVKYISDFNNSGQQLLTLGVSVRDSNGNLQDITEDLKRFNDKGTEVDSGGYFMSLNSNLQEEETVDSLRQKLTGFNIYGGRLSGELYLTAELVSIDNYELAISGQVDESTNIGSLNFTGTFDTPLQNIFKGVQVQLQQTGSSKQDINGYVEGYTSYSGNKGKHSFNLTSIPKDSKISYTVTPLLTYGKLDSIAKSGIIDMSLIGTGKIELSEWRYYNDVTSGKLYLSWGLNTYLRQGAISDELIDDIQFIFYRYDGSSFTEYTSVTAKKRKNYNGNFIENISYDQLPLGQLYLTQIQIKSIYNDVPSYKYFYKFLYTSAYFNDYYTLGEVLDFSTISINLNLKANIELEQSKQFYEDGAITSSPYTYINKEPESFYDTYPFYYVKDRKGVTEYNIVTDYYLEYSNQRAQDLPFSFNEEAVNVTHSISSSKAVVENLDVDYSNSNLLGGFIKENMELGSEAENHTLYKTESLSKDKLSVSINTVSKYLATKGEAQAISSDASSGFRSYMHEENFKSIFGYAQGETGVMTKPRYGLATRIGRKNNSSKLAYWIVEYSGDYLADAQPVIVSENLSTGSTHRRWADNMFPQVVNGLNASINTFPQIFFWIGGLPKEAGGVNGNSKGHSKLITRKGNLDSNDYNLILWKDYDRKEYYILNEFFSKSSATNNGLASLQKIFKNLYINQDFLYTGNMYKSSDYAYTQYYDISYVGNLKSIINAVDGKSKIDTSFNETSIKALIKGITEWTVNESGNEVTKVADLSSFTSQSQPNLQVSVNISGDVTNTFDFMIGSDYISEQVINYIEATGNLSSGGLLSNSGEVYESDYKGNAFDTNKIYYIGADNKVYPIDITAGLTEGSALYGAGVRVSNLVTMNRAFKVGYDEVNKCKQIYLNTGSVKAFTVQDTSDRDTRGWPKLGETADKSFKFGHDDQGHCLDIVLTGTTSTKKLFD